jgi:dihydrofolate synthase/folylpolyglutamate synthase
MGYFPYTYAVFGAMQDKDIQGIVKALGDRIDHWYLTDLPISRAMSAKHIQDILQHTGLAVAAPLTHAASSSRKSIAQQTRTIHCDATPKAAYQNARKQAAVGDRIVVFGSFYTVAGVLDNVPTPEAV